LEKNNKIIKQALNDANVPLPKLSEESERISGHSISHATNNVIGITESHWQVALNKKTFNGKMEVTVATGRIDIVTDTQVIEVDKISKYAEGIAQALKYADATGKQPVLAVYIDGEKEGYKLLQEAGKSCKENGVILVLANSYVSVSDFIELLTEAGKLCSEQLPESAGTLPAFRTESISENVQDKTIQEVELKYWITNSSGIRHNSSCRYYENSNGRKCSKNEGRACKICGG